MWKEIKGSVVLKTVCLRTVVKNTLSLVPLNFYNLIIIRDLYYFLFIIHLLTEPYTIWLFNFYTSITISPNKNHKIPRISCTISLKTLKNTFKDPILNFIHLN